jgi:hypothetical protein
MVTLADIEAAAVSLSPAEKQELMLFLAARLRAEGAVLPEPRVFSADEMARWIAEDERKDRGEPGNARQLGANSYGTLRRNSPSRNSSNCGFLEEYGKVGSEVT